MMWTTCKSRVESTARTDKCWFTINETLEFMGTTWLALMLHRVAHAIPYRNRFDPLARMFSCWLSLIITDSTCRFGLLKARPAASERKPLSKSMTNLFKFDLFHERCFCATTKSLWSRAHRLLMLVDVIAFVTGWIDFRSWKRAKSQVNSFVMKEIELFMGKWFFIFVSHGCKKPF